MKLKKWLILFSVLCLLLCACGGQKALSDGSHTVELTLEGGTGRSGILSPAALEVSGGQMTLTLVWTSSNYDYMIVDGTRYEPVTYDGGSTFVLPLKDLKDLPIVADTVAMSTPHEISYTLHFGTVK